MCCSDKGKTTALPLQGTAELCATPPHQRHRRAGGGRHLCSLNSGTQEAQVRWFPVNGGLDRENMPHNFPPSPETPSKTAGFEFSHTPFHGPVEPQAMAMLVSLTHDLEKNLHSCIHTTSELAFSVKSFTPEKVGQISRDVPVPQQGSRGCSKPLHTLTQRSDS